MPRSTRLFILILAAGMVATAWAPARGHQPPTAAGVATSAGASNEAGPWIDARIYVNTAMLGLGTAAIALPLGALLALLVVRTDLPGRRAAQAALVFLLFLPLYVQVAGWEAAFGKLGWLTSIWQVPLLTGMRAVVFIHAMAAIPWVALIAAIGLRLVRRTEEETALLDASGPLVVQHVVLPQLAPYLLTAGLACAIGAAGDMTVTNIYLVAPGQRTLAEQVYMTLQSKPLGAAAVESLPALAATALIVIAAAAAVRWFVPLQGRIQEDRSLPLVYRLGQWKIPTAFLVWTLMAVLVGLPLASMASKAGFLVDASGETPIRTWSLAKCVTLPGIALWRARDELRWTIVMAAAAATWVLAAAVLLAHACRRRFLRETAILTLAAILWSVPGPVVGLGLVALLNHNVPPLAWLYDETELPAILALGFRALPIVLLATWYAIGRFPRAPLEAAQLDGAGPWTILAWVILPQRAAALAACWLIAFAVASGDLAWSIQVLRPGVDTLPRRLFDFIHAGADDQVSAICLALCVLYAAGSVAAMWLWQFASRSQRTHLAE
jgi:iron(III) transport system permease protein